MRISNRLKRLEAGLLPPQRCIIGAAVTLDGTITQVLLGKW
jgi:hypothetical protein